MTAEKLLQDLGRNDDERLAILLVSDDKFKSLFFSEHSVKLLRYILSDNCSATKDQKNILRDKYLQHCLNEGILSAIIYSAYDLLFLANTFPEKKDILLAALINNINLSNNVVSHCSFDDFPRLIKCFHKHRTQIIKLFFMGSAPDADLLFKPSLDMIKRFLESCAGACSSQTQAEIKESLFRWIISDQPFFNWIKDYNELELFIEMFPDMHESFALNVFTRPDYFYHILTLVNHPDTGEYLSRLYTLFPNHKNLLYHLDSITNILKTVIPSILALSADNDHQNELFTKALKDVIRETENGKLSYQHTLIILNYLKKLDPHIIKKAQSVFLGIAHMQSDREETPTLLTSCLKQMPPNRFRFFGSNTTSSQRIFDLSMLPAELQDLYRFTWSAVGVEFDSPKTSSDDKANNPDRSGGPAR